MTTKTSMKKPAKPTVKLARKSVTKAAAKPAYAETPVKGNPRNSKAVVTSEAPTGHVKNGSIYVPIATSTDTLVPASKLKVGISKAQSEIKESLQEVAALMSMDFEISEIELAMSFSADGKFLGFGVGGSASIKVKIKPLS